MLETCSDKNSILALTSHSQSTTASISKLITQEERSFDYLNSLILSSASDQQFLVDNRSTCR
jgi:hypothetical protein